jgi:hypothetical protein
MLWVHCRSLWHHSPATFTSVRGRGDAHSVNASVNDKEPLEAVFESGLCHVA